MSLEFTCDNCGRKQSYSDNTYCEDCFEELKNTIKDLEKEKEELINKIDKLGTDLSEAKHTITLLKNQLGETEKALETLKEVK